MKVFIIILLGLASQASVAFPIDTSLAVILAEECIITEGANEADVKLFIEGKLPETRKQKCLASCVGKQYEIVSFNRLIDSFESIELQIFSD